MKKSQLIGELKLDVELAAARYRSAVRLNPSTARKGDAILHERLTKEQRSAACKWTPERAVELHAGRLVRGQYKDPVIVCGDCGMQPVDTYPTCDDPTKPLTTVVTWRCFNCQHKYRALIRSTRYAVEEHAMLASAISQLLVGGTLLLTPDEAHVNNPYTVARAAGIKITCRTTNEGVRVWRTK